jgi:hypothetical protein
MCSNFKMEKLEEEEEEEEEEDAFRDFMYNCNTFIFQETIAP